LVQVADVDADAVDAVAANEVIFPFASVVSTQFELLA
jgi:hypothetical protein